MSTRASVVDVSGLPANTFGHGGVVWWATACFMAIEGTTIGVALFSYHYLRGNFVAWPPTPLPLPDLVLPTISMLVLLAVMWPLHRVKQAARALDVAGVRRGLVLGTLGSAAALGLRAFEFGAVNTSWNDNAYGSVVWLVLGLHTSLLIVDVIETAVIAAIFHSDRLMEKHLVDADEAGIYQYFLSLVWVPCWFTLYVFPRIS